MQNLWKKICSESDIMKKINPKIILTLGSMIIGFGVSILIKNNVGIYIPASKESIERTKSEIVMLKEEVKQLDDIIKVKKEKLEDLEKATSSGDEVSEILISDLNYKKIISGYVKMEGPGIVIKMYDNISQDIVGVSVNDDVIHDIDILNILNDLKVAGAEAISINNQRVLSNSEIKCGGPIIRINGTSVGTPFIIKAIGDPQTLMASVNAPRTYGDLLKNFYYIGFEPRIEDKIVIPAYKENLRYKYAKPKGEEGI